MNPNDIRTDLEDELSELDPPYRSRQEAQLGRMLDRYGIPFFVCRACLAARRWKSSAQPDGGEGQATGKGVVARRRLKEAIAKMRPDGQEPDTRLSRRDEWAKGHEVHIHQASRQ